MSLTSFYNSSAWAEIWLALLIGGGLIGSGIYWLKRGA